MADNIASKSVLGKRRAADNSGNSDGVGAAAPVVTSGQCRKRCRDMFGSTKCRFCQCRGRCILRDFHNDNQSPVEHHMCVGAWEFSTNSGTDYWNSYLERARFGESITVFQVASCYNGDGDP
jgi:hypothetical protein